MQTIPIDLVRQGTRLRTVNPEQVARLADSIAMVGLLNPITVYRRGVNGGGISVEGYGIVAGAHRLEACKSLGLVEIEAHIVELDDLHRQLAECDENLCGTVLTPAERALFTRRRKEIYEALHPETRQGGNQSGPCRQFGNTETERFTADTAKKTGTSERAVQRDASRGSRIDEEVLSTIAGTDFDMGQNLDALAKLDADEQRRVAEFVRNDDLISAKAAIADRSGRREANAAFDKMTKEDAADRLAEMLSEFIPGEQWATLTALLYAAGDAKAVAKAFNRLNGAPVFDQTTAGRAA